MLNGIDLLNIIKKASLDAVNASQPCNFCFGKVTSVSPLKIFVEQKLTLGSAQLVLTRNVTDYTIPVTVDWETESKSGESGDDSISQSYSVSGKKEMTIHNALQVGERVVLIKQKGGQKYLVLDRVVNS